MKTVSAKIIVEWDEEIRTMDLDSVYDLETHSFSKTDDIEEAIEEMEKLSGFKVTASFGSSFPELKENEILLKKDLSLENEKDAQRIEEILFDGGLYVFMDTDPFTLLRLEKDSYYSMVKEEIEQTLRTGSIDIKDMELEYSAEENGVLIRAIPTEYHYDLDL